MSAGAVTLRAPVAQDPDAVVALDCARSGHGRRGFFVKRWRAIEAHPDAFVSIISESPDGVAGHALAHIIHGEFGAAVLEAIAVAPGHAERELGRDLISALVAAARERGAREIRTQARWDESERVQFFAQSGFALAPRVVLERGTAAPDGEPAREERATTTQPTIPASPELREPHGRDGDDPERDDGPLARGRIVVRSLAEADTGPVARIDVHITIVRTPSA